MNSVKNESLQLGYEIISMFAVCGLFWVVVDTLHIVDISQPMLLFGYWFGMILAMALVSWYSLGMETGNKKGG